MGLLYAVITPAKNEEQCIPYLLDTMEHQTVLPVRWVIIDDNSIDRTAELVRLRAAKCSWMMVVSAAPRAEGQRGGSKVVDLFYEAYAHLADVEFDIIAKIDADLSLPDNYFERVLEEFQLNTRTGLCGGYCLINRNGVLIKEKTAAYHVRGALKAYRKEALQNIGGLKSFYNWDGLDQYYLIQKGWKVQPLAVGVIHHRPTSTRINRGIVNSFKIGGYYYQQGYNILLAVAKAAVFALNTYPQVLSGVLMLMGYLSAFVLRKEIVVSPELKTFINKLQLKRMTAWLHPRVGPGGEGMAGR